MLTVGFRKKYAELAVDGDSYSGYRIDLISAFNWV